MSFFEDVYAGVPPWDIGRPQGAFVRLAEAGAIRGVVLDVGCGTGENALYLAGLGHEVVGIDAAPTAIRKAKANARERGLEADFLVADALDLPSLGRQFDTVIDCGLFHVFSDPDRAAFAESLRSVLQPGGAYHMMCFSEHVPGGLGPRRVTRDEIRATFADGWRIDGILEEAFETRFSDEGVPAWLSSITRL